MTSAHSEAGTGERAARGPALALAVLAASAALVLVLALTRGEPAPPDESAPSAMGAVTVPPVPDEMTDELPPSWEQPRARPSAEGVWGPDVAEPFDTLWRISTSMEFFAAPALLGGRLYFGGNDGVFRAVDAESGTELWSHATACGLSGEAAAEPGAVYFGGQDGYFYALDSDDGSRLWSAGLGFHLFSGAGLLGDSLVIAGNSDGSVAALSRQDGTVVWHDRPGGLILGPAITDTVAVFTSEDGTVCAYGVSGRRLWLRDFPGLASPPSAACGSVFVAFSDGSVRRLDIRDGESQWEVDLVPGQSRCAMSRPVVSGDRVVLGTCDSRVVCLSAGDGSELWQAVLENWVQVPPAVGDSTVYAACDDKRLHVLSLEDGSALDSLELGGYAGSAPLLVNGTLYLGTAAGEFFAFRGTPRADAENSLQGR
ncbi:PQQ-binding-like beta-propeller repeat protein [Candidatus Fermentibacteria bacterium]|nr:PQQ-binding-like beta-propeller repeat protein [Candidatus Fermentibacteria bacterium]